MIKYTDTCTRLLHIPLDVKKIICVRSKFVTFSIYRFQFEISRDDTYMLKRLFCLSVRCIIHSLRPNLL